MVLDIWMAKYQLMCRESVTQNESCNRPGGHPGGHYRYNTKEAANREWIPYLHAVQSVPAPACTRPPAGWWCSLSEGHEGPCPAHSISLMDEAIMVDPQREEDHYRIDQQREEDRRRGKQLREQLRIARETIDNGPKWLQQAAAFGLRAIKDEEVNRDIPDGEIRTWPVQGKLTSFELYRRNDESGVSGTGLVLQGCIFADGTVAVRWCTENADTSTTVYGIEGGKSGWERFLDIHVQSHPTNDVRIVFYAQARPGYEWNQRSEPEAIKAQLIERVSKGLQDLLKVLEEKSAL